jgi:hypothetical protein
MLVCFCFRPAVNMYFVEINMRVGEINCNAEMCNCWARNRRYGFNSI